MTELSNKSLVSRKKFLRNILAGAVGLTAASATLGAASKKGSGPKAVAPKREFSQIRPASKTVPRDSR